MMQSGKLVKQILVISGKGGTGKTMLSASFAALAQNKVMVDCDVDAANLHLLLKSSVRRSEIFKGGMKALIQSDLCTRCGVCREICRFEAVETNFSINPMDCEGCGFCARMCPSNAITMEPSISGEWFISETQYGPFVHAKLGIAEGNSGKLVSVIRQAAVTLAVEQGKHTVIIDGPPGIGCPVIASLAGVDLAVVVTEPTPAGIHDMERIFSLARQFQVPLTVVINKFDLNPENSKFIHSFSEAHGIRVLGQIPFSDEIKAAVIQGVPPVEFCSRSLRESIHSIWEKIERLKP